MIKKRNMIAQFFLAIITLGIYCIYWFYVTSKEMAQAKKMDVSPALLTILLFIPFANLYSYYKQGELYEVFSDNAMNRWLIFLLWLVFAPAVWFIIQSRLNAEADKLGHEAGKAASMENQSPPA